MIKNRLWIALAAWLLSSGAFILSVLLVIGFFADVFSKTGAPLLFSLVIGSLFVAAWGTQFEMTRAWIQDRKVHPWLAVTGPVLAFVLVALFYQSILFYLPVCVLGLYLAWFHRPWSNNET